jgi:hypothetical protein
VSFPSNPSGKPGWLDVSPHEGVWRKPPDRGSDMKLEVVGSPRWELWMCQMLATPCVASSLTLVGLGGSEPSSGFRFRTLSIGRPTIIVWPFLGTIAVSLGVEGMIMWGAVSYSVFMPKPSTHRMHDPGSIVPDIRPKVFTDNQMSQIKYNYSCINNVSKDYDDSQWNRTSKTP